MSDDGADKPSSMTPAQQKWFASIVESFPRETGKTLDEWVEIARTCPETRPAARKLWLKTHHGLGTNRASVVLGRAFPETAHWAKPDDLRATLWSDPAGLAVLEAVETQVRDLPDLVMAQRKSFTAFSRAYQFAAMRPIKGGGARLGLALEPGAHARLEPPARESWSERLKSGVTLLAPADVDAALADLLKDAWSRS